jgi:hypothetical protein
MITSRLDSESLDEGKQIIGASVPVKGSTPSAHFFCYFRLTMLLFLGKIVLACGST